MPQKNHIGRDTHWWKDKQTGKQTYGQRDRCNQKNTKYAAPKKQENPIDRQMQPIEQRDRERENARERDRKNGPMHGTLTTDRNML